MTICGLSLAQAGDYSTVLVQKVAEDQVLTFDLGTFVIPQNANALEVTTARPNLYDLPIVADLNGDGHMELLRWVLYRQGYGLHVLEWDGRGFRVVLETGCFR